MKKGDRIRITETPEDYKFFSVGDVGTVISSEVSGSLYTLCDFNDQGNGNVVYGSGEYYIDGAMYVKYEVIEIYRPDKLQHTDGFKHGPSNAGSPQCKSGSIASGGLRAYCTCDICY